jgi:hypothetical protein
MTDKPRDSLALAYGLLWHMANDRRDPNLRIASEARMHLSNGLTREEKMRGIEAARERLGIMKVPTDLPLREMERMGEEWDAD